MATYLELQKQIAALQQEADLLKASERKEVIAQMKDAISAYDITASELGLPQGPRRLTLGEQKNPVKSRSTPVTYSDSHGNTWRGVGKRPNWLRDALARGQKLQDFVTTKK